MLNPRSQPWLLRSMICGVLGIIYTSSNDGVWAAFAYFFAFVCGAMAIRMNKDGK